MDFIEVIEQFNIARAWVSIGSFDGVHLGHQALLTKLVKGAHQDHCSAVAITFDPHPSVFFGRVSNRYALSTRAEKERLINSIGADELITLPFDEQLANVDPLTFMTYLRDSLGIERILAGFNFALGKNRSGDIATLSRLGQDLGYSVEIVEPVSVNGKMVSSSQIREFLNAGQIREAKILLGRSYTVEGVVVHGEHRGGKLGIPTANLDVPQDRILPANGVYATRCWFGERKIDAVTNVGVRPTFENPLLVPRVEPHLLDTREDFYGQPMTLEFIEHIRSEVKFPDADALIRQIKLDIEIAREVLSHEA